MQVNDVEADIKNKRLGKVYILYGEEVGVRKVYEDRIKNLYCEINSGVVTVTDTVVGAYKAAGRKALFPKPTCYVVYYDEQYLKQPKLWDSVLERFNASNDMLIIVYGSLDKRGKFYKKYKNEAVFFDYLPTVKLMGMVKELDPDNIDNVCAKKLVDISFSDYSKIVNTHRKIAAYISATGCTYIDALNELISDGTINKPIGDITFKLTDAVISRDIYDTGTYLVQARLKGEPELRVLSVLYNNFKEVLLVQGLGADRNKNTCERTGLTMWQVKRTRGKLGHYAISELVDALTILRSVEVGIKTGQVDAQVGLEYAIVKIVRKDKYE